MVDELMVPAVEIPPQDVRPWAAVLERLLTDRAHYEHLAAESRRAALEYARDLNAGPFEAYLEKILRSPSRCAGASRPNARAPLSPLSEDRRRLLALRLKRANTHVAD
jgi:hypothetical protein